jgi:hypothetical protein
VQPDPYVPPSLDMEEFSDDVRFHKIKTRRQLYEYLVRDLRMIFHPPNTPMAHIPEEELVPLTVSDVTLNFTDAQGVKWRRYATGKLVRG